MRLYGSLWFLTVPYRSLCILIDSNGSVWIFRSPYVTLLILVGLFQVLMRPYGF